MYLEKMCCFWYNSFYQFCWVERKGKWLEFTKCEIFPKRFSICQQTLKFLNLLKKYIICEIFNHLD